MLEKNISKRELYRFLHAEVGARLVYHVGNLAADRLADHELGQIAQTLFNAAEAGLCRLLQRRADRDGDGMLYIAEHR